MRNFYCIVTLRNGCRFAGVVSARSAGAARTYIRAEAARTDITCIDVEAL